MSRRQSLADRLNGLASNMEDEFTLEVIKEIFDVAQDGEGFRYTAPTTTGRQNLHLKELLRFYRTTALFGSEFSDEDVKKSLFSKTADDVLRIMKGYFVIAMKFCVPRSITDSRPRYQTLIQRRFSMLFWMRREMQDRAPSRARFLNTTNSVLQYAGRKYGVNRNVAEKAYLGRRELEQLLEADMFRCPLMALAESFHLAWVLGCVCGVRPGSMAYSDGRQDQFLTWRDIVITRGKVPGLFDTKITFRYLKGNRDDLEASDVMTFYINSPTLIQHISMSPPHRLLIMLLRRGFLQDHDSLESLLNGKEKLIRIKGIAMDRPILLAGGPRGLSVTEKAMSAKSLYRYTLERTMAEGYGRGVGPYAWRRKAGTEVQRQQGTETAQKFMTHAAGSETFNKYYDQRAFDLPVFEIAMRADINIARAEMDENSSPVLTRAIDLTRLKGAFLDQAVWRLEAEDLELQAAIDDGMLEKVRSIKRRIKRTAYNQLYDEEIKRAGESMTVDEFEARKKDLLATPSLMHKIISASRKELEGGNRKTDAPQQPAAAHGSSSEHIDKTNLRYADLRDEEDHANTPGGEIRLDTDDLDDEDMNQEESPLEFLEAVRVFMESLGQVRLVQLDGGDLHCQKCIDDPTMGEEAAQKVWANATKLRYHERSAIHSAKSQFSRRIEIEKAGVDRYQCPYDSECPSYADKVSLMRHIEGSDSSNTNQDHDDAKRADGWYELDFKSNPAKANPKQVRSVRSALGWKYSEEKECEPMEVDVVGGVTITQAAGPSWKPIHDAHKGMVFGGDQVDIREMMQQPISEIYRGIVWEGDEMEV
ncbi:hypothetical protein VTL71DRAFT_14744 [Oculimacula yallundae]|uniref:Uncharacterized protein n=1 Tax=Oculimacula yallundae TaxID=86028 RepID=A0ABR4CJW0_9HELO